MSQIHFREIPLAEVAKSAPVTLEATFRGEETGGCGFQLDDDRRIRVWEASAAAWGQVRRRTEATGMSISPIVPALEGYRDRRLVPGERYVLFLTAGAAEDEYVFAAEGAWVGPERFKERPE